MRNYTNRKQKMEVNKRVKQSKLLHVESKKRKGIRNNTRFYAWVTQKMAMK